jgi:hypothetical protein
MYMTIFNNKKNLHTLDDGNRVAQRCAKMANDSHYDRLMSLRSQWLARGGLSRCGNA